MDLEKTGKFIAELRKEKNMTQQDLADLIPVSREAVSKWERGKSCPNNQILIKFSEIFNISIEELIYGERKNNTNLNDINQIVGKIYDDNHKKHKIISSVPFHA